MGSEMCIRDSTYLLRIQDKTVTLLPESSDVQPDTLLTADISDFSSFVIGAVSLSELLRLGRVQLSDPSFARDVQNAIGWDEKPCNYTYF